MWRAWLKRYTAKYAVLWIATTACIGAGFLILIVVVMVMYRMERSGSPLFEPLLDKVVPLPALA